MSNSQSRVVFVGNVPYNMGEEQLIEIFKNVGEVVGFRLVYDRETGKPRGYGFCEFADHETAMSAVRNLNNQLVDGRPLRIDLADSDPFLEGKTTSRGELLDDGSRWREDLPTGVPIPPGATALDVITQSLANMRPQQAMEVLSQMKGYIMSSPDQARQLLVAHPQLAYALFQALLLHQIVDPAVLHRMLGAAQAQAQPAPPPPPPQPQIPSVPVPMPSYNAPPPVGGARAPAPMLMPGYPPPPPAMVPPPPAVGMYGPPPIPVATPVSVAPTPPAGMPDQHKVLMQVLQLTPDQLALLPENDRKAIMDLRNKFMPQ